MKMMQSLSGMHCLCNYNKYCATTTESRHYMYITNVPTITRLIQQRQSRVTIIVPGS